MNGQEEVKNQTPNNVQKILKEKTDKVKDAIKAFWHKKTKREKIILASVSACLALVIVGGIIFLSVSRRYNPDKYNPATVSFSGGSGAENVNVSAINIQKGELGSVDLKISFTEGSNVNTAIPSPIPEFKAEFIPQPLRLKLTFKGVAFWDYIINGLPIDESGTVLGVFQVSPNQASDTTEIYFNLGKQVEYKIIEESNVLTVSLLGKGTPDKTAYYVLADFYYEYQQGTMEEKGFTPMLCDDFISVVMISKPFASEAEATREKERLLTSSMEGKTLRVVKLGNQLPQYAENTDTSALLSESVLSVDGAKTTLPLFYADARFLCWLPDSSAALFAHPEEDGERLYTADKIGTKRVLSDKAFSNIGKATFSANGKMLAFVEYTEEVELITVLNTETGEVKTVSFDSEELTTVMGVALDESGSNLFYLSGNQFYSLKKRNLASGTEEILDESVIVESELVLNNGYLYYCDVVDEWEVIVRRSLSTGEQEVLHKGSQFSISADGKTMATITENYDTAVKDLRLVYLENKSWETVLFDVVTTEFFIDSDNNSVFYIVETGDEEFYYQIMKYDIKTQETSVMAQCINGVFFQSNKANELIISVIYSNDLGTHPVTYIADFDKITSGASQVN
ncbi:MAG: hypothetical protein IKB86_02175 [Clostridia bacterium]|nr:hypothetical protein [Clostridia bacterium]